MHSYATQWRLPSQAPHKQDIDVGDVPGFRVIGLTAHFDRAILAHQVRDYQLEQDAPQMTGSALDLAEILDQSGHPVGIG